MKGFKDNNREDRGRRTTLDLYLLAIVTVTVCGSWLIVNMAAASADTAGTRAGLDVTELSVPLIVLIIRLTGR